MARGAAARGIRRRLAIGAIAGAASAAVGMTATTVVVADRPSSDAQAVVLEGAAYPSADNETHVHDPVRREAERAERDARCATPEGLAANPALCPQPDAALVRRAAAAPPPAMASSLLATGAEPASVGAWSPPADLGIGTTAQHGILLPTGKVLIVGPAAPGTANTSIAVVYDPATGARTRVDPPADPRTGLPYNIWCSGHVLLTNGTVLVAGGNDAYVADQTKWRGLNRLFTFNPYTLTWTDQGPMASGDGRWYPTVTLLADGRAVIYGGNSTAGAPAYNYEIDVFTPHPTDRDGRGTTTWIDRGRNPGLYSQAALLPDGRVLFAGPLQEDPMIMNPAAGFTLQDLPNRDERYWGAFTLTYEGDRRLMRRIGGAGVDEQATQRATAVVDLDAPGTEQPGPELGTARAHVDAVVLPTGEILAVGGGLGKDETGTNYAGPVYQSELLSPQSNSWRPVASLGDERTYHSVALLLPDGRVLAAGDDRERDERGVDIGDVTEDTYEIYSPPYLFGGPRPQITALTREIRHGLPFTIESPQAASITRAVLIAPAAVTHSTDMNQRSVRLDFTRQGDTLTLTAPSGPTIAPAGHYMLFVVDAAGVPSVARWVALGTEIGPIIPDDGPGAVVSALPGGGAGVAAAARRCQGRRATIVGSARRDVLRGTRRADVIVGLGGNDVIVGLGGNDRICGGPGRDRLVGGAGADRLEGGAGNDVLLGGPGPDLLAGGAGRDRLVGGPGRNLIVGGTGRDVCVGGKGTRFRAACEVIRRRF